jgi:hypothetical protein
VLWFVVVTTIGLLLAGGGILIVVERALMGQAERHAVDRARVATSALLDRQLRAGDLTGALSSARRRQLSALFSRASLGAESSSATLYGGGGVIFTTNRAAVRVPTPPSVQRALNGQVVSDVTSTGSGRVLRAFLPLVLSDGNVVTIAHSYNVGGEFLACIRNGSFACVSNSSTSVYTSGTPITRSFTLTGPFPNPASFLRLRSPTSPPVGSRSGILRPWELPPAGKWHP